VQIVGYTNTSKGYPIAGHESPDGEYRYRPTLSLTSVPDGVGGQRHAPAALPPGKTRYPLYRRLGGPHGRSGRVRNISPPPGFSIQYIRGLFRKYPDWPQYMKQIRLTRSEPQLSAAQFPSAAAHFAQRFCHCWKHFANSSFGMSDGVFVEFRLMSSVASNRCPFTTFLTLWRLTTPIEVVPHHR